MPRTTLLTNARLADDRLVDVYVGSDDSTVDRELSDTMRDTVLHIVDAGKERSDAQDGYGPVNDKRDLTGYVLLPTFTEPHAHLDKALSADSVANPTGDLGGAIAAWLDHRPTITHDNYVRRALAAIELYWQNGITTVRSHVDLGLDVDTSGLEALLEVKATVADQVRLQLVGLPFGLTGENSDAVIQMCHRALDLGLDIMGGVPHIEDDPAKAIDVILELAGSYDRRVDIHADENLNPNSADLETLSQAVIRTGFQPSATASHCVALSMKAPDEQERVAALTAEAGVTVVALPHTNLYLQARDQTTAPPRGLAPASLLQRSGVKVIAGGDNLQDPFNPLGSGDPLETAALMVLAGHLTPLAAVNMVAAGRAVIAEGDRADFAAVPGQSLREILAVRPADRQLIKFDV